MKKSVSVNKGSKRRREKTIGFILLGDGSFGLLVFTTVSFALIDRSHCSHRIRITGQDKGQGIMVIMWKSIRLFFILHLPEMRSQSFLQCLSVYLFLFS